MNRFLTNERGLSLIELLVAVAIGSLLLILVSTIHIFIQNQYDNQITDVKQLTNLTLAMKSITKDIRSTDIVEVSEDHRQLTLINENQTTIYTFEDDTLKRNHLPYVDQLENFEVTKEDDATIIIIVKQQTGKEMKTEIVMRGG